jgi:hypothetical protein
MEVEKENAGHLEEAKEAKPAEVNHEQEHDPAVIKAEKKLRWKVDLFLLPLLSLSIFFGYLVRSSFEPVYEIF